MVALFDWLEWQCNAWEWGKANDQGRGFLFNDEDIYSIESLYKHLKSLRLRQLNSPYTEEVEVYIGLMSASVLDISITTFLT